jgi:hypothetical protein
VFDIFKSFLKRELDFLTHYKAALNLSPIDFLFQEVLHLDIRFVETKQLQNDLKCLRSSEKIVPILMLQILRGSQKFLGH